MLIIGIKKEIITSIKKKRKRKTRSCFNKTVIDNSWIKKNIQQHKKDIKKRNRVIEKNRLHGALLVHERIF